MAWPLVYGFSRSEATREDAGFANIAGRVEGVLLGPPREHATLNTLIVNGVGVERNPIHKGRRGARSRTRD